MISRKHSSTYRRSRSWHVPLEVRRVPAPLLKSTELKVPVSNGKLFRGSVDGNLISSYALSSDGSYAEMIKNPNIEIVYIGNVHAFRRETVEMSLMANKHVLVEKPFACSVADGEYLIALAKERNLFIMEGMWTRFFPAVQKARNFMSGTATEPPMLGDISKVYSDFNFYAPDNEEYPTSFFYNHKLGGGAALLIAPYPIAVATMCFANPPNSAKVVGQKDEETGVDLQGGMILSFPPTGTKHDGIAPKLPGYVVRAKAFFV